MPKQRFSALDIACSCTELNDKLAGLRLANVYDINPKTFLLKFQKPDLKHVLLIESGLRIHTTQYARDKQQSPSGFNQKYPSTDSRLRKHLKTRRVTSVKQIGSDRRIDIQFGEDVFAYHLICEFFALGNIILTDHELNILAILRVVDVEDYSMAVGKPYDILPSSSFEFEPMTAAKLLAVVQKMTLASIQDSDDVLSTVDNVEPIATKSMKGPNSAGDSKPLKGFNKKKSKKKANTLKSLLRTYLGPTYGPSLVDHAIAKARLDPQCSDFTSLSSETSPDFIALLRGFENSDDVVVGCMNDTQKGYITADTLETTTEVKEGEDSVTFDEFHPFLPAYLDPAKQVINFTSFDAAVDEFFSKVESQKLQLKARQAEVQAFKKLENVKRNHANAIQGFVIDQETKELMALAIESNVYLVDTAISTVRSFVASGMDWIDLENLVKEEQEAGNPIALLITRLKLDIGRISLSLPDPRHEESDSEMDDETDSEADSDSEQDTKSTKPTSIVVDVDIYQTAFANARSYYTGKKIAAQKEKKTAVASVKAIEISEKKIMQTLKTKETQASTITRFRTPYWFEKFLWFISTENYLVVGGRDPAQNELLITKYMSPSDFYVSSEMHGAPSILVKQLLPKQPRGVPSTTLLQAGTMAISHSQAWDSKILTSAYWAYPKHVTKVSGVGDLLPVGAFRVLSKEHLPPTQLVYGVGLLYVVDEGSVERHLLERRPWGRGEDVVAESLESVVNTGVDHVDEVDKNLNKIACLVEEKEVGAVKDLLPVTQALEIDDGSGEGVGDGPGDFDGETQTARKHLSARERRNIRKGKQGDTQSPTVPGPIEKVELEDTMSIRSEDTTQSQSQVPAGRGRKGKMKKIKEKYADQDEEDRIAMLERTGVSTKGPQPKGKRAKAKAAAALQQQELQEKSKLRKEQPKVAPKPKNEGKPAQGGAALPLGVETDSLNLDLNLDCLTGQPHPSDLLIGCIPVCAPWTTLQKYKYKIKLLPGSGKRGKAAKQALQLFTSAAEKDSALAVGELDFMKGVTEAEWINAMLSKVKVVTDGKSKK